MDQTNAMKKVNFSSALWYIVIVGGTMGLGFLSGLLSGANAGYEGYTRPPLTPPDLTFAIVWPVLYFLTGTGMYLMLNAPAEGDKKPIKTSSEVLWIIGVALSFAWSFVFFTLDLKTLAFIISTLIFACVTGVVVLDFFYCKTAAWLNIPFMLWVGFATYLGIFIALYN